MAPVTYTSHPRVTIEHRPGGPVVVHDRRGSEQEVRSGRVKTVIAGLIGLAFLGFLLFMSWWAGDLDGTDLRNAALAGVALVAVVGYLFVVGRGREEISLSGDNLVIRARPLNIRTIGPIERRQVGRIQVEMESTFRRDAHRVQIVDPDGRGLLAPSGALSRIPTRDETTALASAIAQHFGLKFVPGVQTPAGRPPSIVQQLVGPPPSREEPNPYRSADGLPYDGSIRLKHSAQGPTVLFQPTLLDRIQIVVETTLLAIFIGVFVARLNLGGPISALVIFVTVLVIGYRLVVRLFNRYVFAIENGALRWRCLPLPVPSFNGIGQVHLANINRLTTDTWWDSYDKAHHKLVVRTKGGPDVITLIDPILEADGHALCQALHKHLGIPI